MAAAVDSGERVRVAGSGHSFSDLACTDGVMVSMRRLGRVLRADPATGTVTAQAGTTLRGLNTWLAEHGLALPVLGEIDAQTIAGAIATGTHGTGARFGSLSTLVTGLDIVTGDGRVLRCSAEEEPGIFHAARVGLGALGVVTAVTLRCVPSFQLHVVEEVRRLADVLDALDELVDRNDHFEFLWFPHTDRVRTRTSNRTGRPPRPRSRLGAYMNDIVLENRAFGALCRIGRARPSWIPAINRSLVKAVRRREWVDRSDRVFIRPRQVRYVEMEYAIPRPAAADAIRAVRELIDGTGLMVAFPVHLRFSAADDIPLSPSYARETCHLAVHVPKGISPEPLFRGVEAIMDSFHGRPHWGKMHSQTAETLRGRYPGWEAFAGVRARVDPEGRFRNAHLDRVLDGA